MSARSSPSADFMPFVSSCLPSKVFRGSWSGIPPVLCKNEEQLGMKKEKRNVLAHAQDVSQHASWVCMESLQAPLPKTNNESLTYFILAGLYPRITASRSRSGLTLEFGWAECQQQMSKIIAQPAGASNLKAFGIFVTLTSTHPPAVKTPKPTAKTPGGSKRQCTPPLALGALTGAPFPLRRSRRSQIGE